MRQGGVTKCESYFITKCEKRYYKVRHVLQSTARITKYRTCYKVRHVLQSTARVNTKCDGTGSGSFSRAFPVRKAPPNIRGCIRQEPDCTSPFSFLVHSNRETGASERHSRAAVEPCSLQSRARSRISLVPVSELLREKKGSACKLVPSRHEHEQCAPGNRRSLCCVSRRGNMYFTSLPLVSARRYGRV